MSSEGRVDQNPNTHLLIKGIMEETHYGTFLWLYRTTFKRIPIIQGWS